MYRVRTHSASLTEKTMFGVYLIGTLAGVGGLEGTAPFWPCAVLVAAGTLLSLKSGRKVVFGY